MLIIIIDFVKLFTYKYKYKLKRSNLRAICHFQGLQYRYDNTSVPKSVKHADTLDIPRGSIVPLVTGYEVTDVIAMADDPEFLKELREEYDSTNDTVDPASLKADDPASLKSKQNQLGESKQKVPTGESKQKVPTGESTQKTADPKDNFVVDDGVDRDAEWEQFEKDEAKRKADRKAKDESDKEAEQKVREKTKEKV